MAWGRGSSVQKLGELVRVRVREWWVRNDKIGLTYILVGRVGFHIGDFMVDEEAVPEALVEVPTEAEGDHQGSRV